MAIMIRRNGRITDVVPVTIVGRYPPRMTKVRLNGKTIQSPPGMPFRFVRAETQDGESIDIEVSHLGGHQPDVDRAVEMAPLIE